MPSIELATGPVTWGVDFADAPGNPPWETVLDEIERSGVSALELGPVGYLPEDPETLREALRSRGLTAVGSFIFDDMHEPARGEEIVVVAQRACRAIAAAGGRLLVIIDKPGPERVATAGRSEAASRLPHAAWSAMLETIERVADVAREHGLRPALHPHAGSFIEFEDEIERIAADTALDLCLDTGHLAYAGSDPVAMLRSHASRLAHVHLKDVDGAVLARVREHRLDFWSALEQRIFCPLGEGVVDLPAVLAELERQRYEGFATIEQDRVPGSGTPLEDLRASLRALGA
jgi:inosose dehydratase